MARDRKRPALGMVVAAGIAVVGMDVAMFAVTGRFVATDAGASTGTTTAATPVTFDVANGTANAGADYVVYFNGAFANFTPGVVASSFPLSHAHLDNSPFAEATASPVDTGPAGGTAVSTWNTNAPSGAPTLSQPQYTEAKYPPGTAKPVTFTTPAGQSASSTASATGASASATVANTVQSSGAQTGAPAAAGVTSVPGSAPASSGRAALINAFNAAMGAWRNNFMTSSAAAAHPAVAADASAPDGSDGDTSSGSVTVSPSGALVATGDARLAQASFGGGALVFHSVHTAVTITNAGTPKADVVTTVGDVMVGGVPVSVGLDGVTVGPQTVPTDQLQQATAQLNAILAAAGITVGTLAPAIKTTAKQETVTATAATVTIDQPGPPEQTVRHNLGNVFVDNLAIPSLPVAAAPVVGNPADGLTGAGAPAVAGSSGFAPIASGATAPTGAAPSTTASGASSAASSGTQAGSSSPDATLGPVNLAGQSLKPKWLLAMYVVWQLIMLGTGASVWWWRSARRAGALSA